MGSSFSSYRRISNRSNRSSNSFNSTTLLPISQQPVSLPAPAEPTRLVITSTTGSETTQIENQSVDPITMTRESANEGTTSPMEIHMVNPSSSTDEDDPQQSESKRIAEIAQPVSVAALSLTLLVNAPKSIEPKLLFPYNAYFVSLCLSLFTSIGLCMYSLVKSAPSQDLTWFQKRVMIISTGSVLISVILRLFLELPATNMGYDGLSFLAIIGVIILYLWYSKSKANSSQTIPSNGINNIANEV